MKVATILPTAYLYLIEDRNYHMALAHLIGVDKEYTQFYKNQSSLSEKYVILDNGVIETKKPMPIEQLCERAQLISAHEIVLPDVYCDSFSTLQLVERAIHYVQTQQLDIRLMAVAQGDTLEDWFNCAKELLKMPIDTLGIPKVLTHIAGRDARLYALMQLKDSLSNVDVHLLGCWESPIEILSIARAELNEVIHPVRGVDSAIAYVYAREGMLISEGPRPSGEIDFSAKDADVEILKKNIHIWEDSAIIYPSNVYRLY